jgi:transposase
MAEIGDYHNRLAAGNPWIKARPSFLTIRGIEPVIPSKENEDRTKRSVVFDKEAYRQRNVIERLIGWLKESRRIFSRFEKTAKNFGGMLTLAFIRQYLKYELV